MDKKLDCSRRITAPPVRSKDVVADVHGAELEPIAVGVIVNPADDLVTDHDARRRLWYLSARAQPPLPLRVTATDQHIRLTDPGRTKDDHTIRYPPCHIDPDAVGDLAHETNLRRTRSSTE
jgi:hypothetical protein